MGIRRIVEFKFDLEKINIILYDVGELNNLQQHPLVRPEGSKSGH